MTDMNNIHFTTLDLLIENSIKSVLIHWSENTVINDYFNLGEDDHDIEKEVSYFDMIDLLSKARRTAPEKLTDTYDKTKFTLTLTNGNQIRDQRFHSTKQDCDFKAKMREIFENGFTLY